jgi:hypothetical protein
VKTAPYLPHNPSMLDDFRVQFRDVDEWGYKYEISSGRLEKYLVGRRGSKIERGSWKRSGNF